MGPDAEVSVRVGLADILDEYLLLREKGRVVALGSDEQARQDHLRAMLNRVMLPETWKVRSSRPMMAMTDSRAAALENAHLELVRRGGAKAWAPPI